MPKISELNPLTSLSNDDLIPVVNDPNGAPSNNKVTFNNFANSVYQYLDTKGVLSTSANTGNIRFNQDVIYTNSGDNIYINNPENAIQIGGQWLVQMSATSNATNLWGDGNTQAYAWVYQDPGGNEYAEFGTYISKHNNQQSSEVYVTTDPNRIFTITAHDNSASPAISTVWTYDLSGIIHLPNDVGDIYRNGVSVLGGTIEIDGGNAFTTPTAEITVDGGGA